MRAKPGLQNHLIHQTREIEYLRAKLGLQNHLMVVVSLVGNAIRGKKQHFVFAASGDRGSNSGREELHMILLVFDYPTYVLHLLS